MVLEKTLESPLDCKETQPVHPKEISPEYSLEELMLKLYERGADLIPGWGRSPGGGHDNPLQYSCLENPWTEKAGALKAIGSHRIEHN